MWRPMWIHPSSVSPGSISRACVGTSRVFASDAVKNMLFFHMTDDEQMAEVLELLACSDIKAQEP